jgi:hypothetical protein
VSDFLSYQYDNLQPPSITLSLSSLEKNNSIKQQPNHPDFKMKSESNHRGAVSECSSHTLEIVDLVKVVLLPLTSSHFPLSLSVSVSLSALLLALSIGFFDLEQDSFSGRCHPSSAEQ